MGDGEIQTERSQRKAQKAQETERHAVGLLRIQVKWIIQLNNWFLILFNNGILFFSVLFPSVRQRAKAKKTDWTIFTSKRTKSWSSNRTTNSHRNPIWTKTISPSSPGNTLELPEQTMFRKRGVASL